MSRAPITHYGRPAGLLPRYEHKRVPFWATFAQNGLIVFLLFITLVCLLAAFYDMAQQLIKSKRLSRVSDVVITFGTWVVILVVGVIIWISRALSLRGTLGSIPRAYVPIKSEDVPAKAAELISNEFDRASVIALISRPEGRRMEGWGRPGTEYEGIHFRTAILSTIPVLQSLPLPLSSSLPPALHPLADLYDDLLSKAKYGKMEPTEEEYEECVKIVAVFVGVLQARNL
ncbi:hypothetical protein T439DRAFT_329218 [Meredithblackwellia eburnea MCA 4105]